MKRITTSIIAILAATTAPVLAESVQGGSNTAGDATKGAFDSRPDFQRTDANRDGIVDSAEMDGVSAPAFSRWDEDGNQRLSGDEFARGLHDAWTNEKGVVDKASFSKNWGHWFSAGQPEFDGADENNDKQISVNEMHALLNSVNFQGRWQGADDGYLTPEEFRNGLAAVNDLDGNGKLDESEFGRVLTIVGIVVPDQEQTASTATSSGTDNSQAQSGMETASQNTAPGVAAGKIIPLTNWSNERLYQNGWSAEAFFGRTVVSEAGDEIGDVEDLVVSSDGRLVSVVAEVGGLWDIGDTHVSVPWEMVTIRDDGSVQIPVTENNVDEFGFFNRTSARELGNNVVSGLDDKELGARAWRASELIGDLARIRNSKMDVRVDGQPAGEPTGQVEQQAQLAEPQPGAGRRSNRDGYGYVDDLIIQDGKIAATVINVDAGYGTGRRAYPFYGYEYGWNPGSRYYDLPYTSDEANRIVPFDSEKLNRG